MVKNHEASAFCTLMMGTRQQATSHLLSTESVNRSHNNYRSSLSIHPQTKKNTSAKICEI